MMMVVGLERGTHTVYRVAGVLYMAGPHCIAATDILLALLVISCQMTQDTLC